MTHARRLDLHQQDPVLKNVYRTLRSPNKTTIAAVDVLLLAQMTEDRALQSTIDVPQVVLPIVLLSKKEVDLLSALHRPQGQ